MAERRMLHRKVSVSEDLAELRSRHGADAVVFYTWLIPHLDRWGCCPANPGTLRALVIPRFAGVTDEKVGRWVAWMVRRGMLEKVTGPAGDKGLRCPGFHDHQRGTEFQKESPSRYEPADITERWIRTGRKPKVADLRRGRRPVSDQVASRSVRREKKELLFPPTPQGDPDTEAPPGGEHHRLAPRPDVHHDDATTRTTNGELASAADVLAAMLHRQEASAAET
jgi:hypothetical protein